MALAVSQVTGPSLQAAAEQSWWQENGDEISAGITLVVTILIAFLVDRLVIGRGVRAAEKSETGVSRTTQTRLRVVRRLVFVSIFVIGIALALSQFAEIKRLATGILASGAVIGLVAGFAARQPLGNMAAGVMLAITQPIRIGDRISFEDVTGRVDDLSLSYTYIDPGDGNLVVVPNEKIVSGTVYNHSTGDRAAPITAIAWLPADADVGRAIEVVKAEAGAGAVRLADWTPEGIKLEVRVTPEQHQTRVGDEEAVLRERAQRALQSAGLLRDG
jgi:small-conductance mechanosensitive channel